MVIIRVSKTLVYSSTLYGPAMWISGEMVITIPCSVL